MRCLATAILITVIISAIYPSVIWAYDRLWGRYAGPEGRKRLAEDRAMYEEMF